MIQKARFLFTFAWIIQYIFMLNASFSDTYAEGVVDDIKRAFHSLSSESNFYGVVLVHDSEGKDLLVLVGKVLFKGKTNFVFNANNDQFLIASLTKEFTAAAILHALWNKHSDLGHSERLQAVQADLNKPIATYLNDKPHAYGNRLPVWTQKITLDQLLANTSGLEEFFFRREYRDHPQDFINLAPALELFFTEIKEPQFTPGSAYLYSNTNYLIATAILENITGTPYGAYLDQIFFIPLGMYDTFVMSQGTINDVRKKHPHLVEPYILTFSQIVPYKSNLNMGVAQGAGGIVSTARDFKKWQTALHGTKQVLNEDLYHLMITNHVQRGHSYGYGIQLDRSRAYGLLLGHEGALERFRSLAYYLPEQKIGIMLFSNFDSNAKEPVGSELMVKTMLDALQFEKK